MKAENKDGETVAKLGRGCDGFMEEWVPFWELTINRRVEF